MKLKDILKKVGGAVFSEVVPGGNIILDAVGFNGDKATATGTDIEHDALIRDPTILAKEFDVKLEQIKQRGETLRAMLQADAQSKHSTRPYIAKHAFHVVALVAIGSVVIWGRAVWTADEELVGAISDGWPFLLSLTAPFVALLNAYFGILKHEHKNRLDSAHGATNPSGLAGLFSTLINRGK